MRVGIIGCGITGAYLGWKLSRAGHEVTIFEKKQKIGKEVCSGLISERLWNFIPKNEALIENKINYTKLHLPKKTVILKFKPQVLVLRHDKLDNYVADLALKSGAKIIHTEIKQIPEGFDRVIGADGALSFTRKSLNLKNPDFRQGIQFFVKEKNSDDFVDTWSSSNGFIWKIPRGAETEYGILSDLETARKNLDIFCKKNNIKIENPQAALVPMGLITSGSPKIALCGDAAGLTKPWSGGGVVWSLTAADILLKTFPDFDKYNLELKKYFSPILLKTKLITKLGYFLGYYLPKILPAQHEIDSDWL